MFFFMDFLSRSNDQPVPDLFADVAYHRWWIGDTIEKMADYITVTKSTQLNLMLFVKLG